MVESVMESPALQGFKIHVDVAPGDKVSGGLGSAGGTAGLSNHRGLSQSKQFHDSSSVCTLSIPYTFPKTKGKGKYRIFPGLKTKATRKQTYTENF